ncbi:hypothetical protein PoB_000225900 [Plakobranchus ocellatus]|uniref:Uncharacterized protein n=1 Tax=Plakobranchus ocellatus TaxID=259542 RepID=A0AAV3Y0K8_9GAST|nr:hypothetical protein PoB_000225900 [Plakobranchus ocellatus]
MAQPVKLLATMQKVTGSILPWQTYFILSPATTQSTNQLSSEDHMTQGCPFFKRTTVLIIIMFLCTLWQIKIHCFFVFAISVPSRHVMFWKRALHVIRTFKGTAKSKGSDENIGKPLTIYLTSDIVSARRDSGLCNNSLTPSACSQ